MRRKNVITKALSWLLVTSMLVIGSTTSVLLPVSAAGMSGQDEGNQYVESQTAPENDAGRMSVSTSENSTVLPENTGSTDESMGETRSQDKVQKDILVESGEEYGQDGIVVVNSPVVDAKDRSITFKLNAATGSYTNAKEVFLRGDVIHDWNKGLAMTKQNNVFSVTVQNVNPGVYTYKYVVDNVWITDPHNKKTVSTAEGANSVVYMPGLASPDAAVSVMNGAEKQLPTTLKYYDDKGNFTTVPVTYSVPAQYQDCVTVNGSKVTVNKEVGQKVEVTATYQSGDITDTTAVTLQVVEAVYTYHVYYYDFEPSRMAIDKSQLWMWEPNVSEGVAYDFTGTEDIEVNGTSYTWLKGSYELSNKDVAIIARSFGGWTWQNSSKGMVYHNESGQPEVNLYIVSSSKTIYTQAPDLQTLKPRERYIMIEYDRDSADYDGWNIYTWNSGYEKKINLQDIGGKKVAKIKVKDSVADLTLGFIMRRSGATSDWLEKDGGDNYLTIPASQTVLKAQFKQGEGVVSTTPDNVGCEMDGNNKTVHFYYRDDAKYADYDMEALQGKVSVSINGIEYPMSYNQDEERFYYDVTNIADGDKFSYCYVVDGSRVLDQFNENRETGADGQEYNVCTYYDFKLSMSLSTSLKEMDYNQNNVVTVNASLQDGQDEDAFAVKSIVCDLSSLGGPAEFSIDPELMEGTISVKDTIPPATYPISVVLTDVCGNTFQGSIDIVVKERVKESGDFDWDEAVVYFAVTDRFFDGDASNNDAYGVGDYNTSTATTEDGGGSSYHGGDFAGLTQKLDYLQDLGVNTIWITPIVENITQDLSSTEGLSAYGYHGYWTSNFTKLNKHLGTEEQFQALLDAAHARNMKIMVDVVINHAGYDTEEYFNSIISDGKGGYISMVRDDSTTVDGDTVRDGLSGLPDFVTENPAVRDQLVQWQVDWVDKYDIDYYRVDTVKHVESTTWKAFKNELTKVNPEFKMIGEYAGGGYASDGGELGTGSMDALLDFDFNDLAQRFITGDLEAVEALLCDRNNQINNTRMLGSFLGSHDEAGFITRLCSDDDETGGGLSEEEARKLYRIAVSLQLTAKGMPVIYYNEIIGASGEENYPYQTNRADFDWNEADTQQFEKDSIYNHYKMLLSIRNQYTAVFAKGSRTTISASDAEGYALIRRSYQNQNVYVGLNIADTAKQAELMVEANAVYRDLYNQQTYQADDTGKLTFVIPKAGEGGTAILVKAVEAQSITAMSGNTSLCEGETLQLKVALEPVNTTTNVVWSSSDEKVAVVSTTGVVKGVAQGTATITATLGDGSGRKVQFPITVTKQVKTDENQPGVPPVNPPSNPTNADNPPDEMATQPVVGKVTKLTISGPSKKLAAGKTVKLSVKVTPKNAENKNVVWKSSNTKYAAVDANGKVKLKKAGIGKSVTITATAMDGSNKKAAYKIKIMKHAVKSIQLSAKAKFVKAGKTLKLKTTVRTTGKSVNKTLKWTSSNTKYATVSKSGKVKAKKAGIGKTVTITAASTDGTNKKAKIKLKIKK